MLLSEHFVKNPLSSYTTDMYVPSPSIRRFIRYASVGVSTFLFDLALLVAFTELLHIPYYIGTPIAFLIAVSINYAVSRTHVFRGTERSVHHGYLYFIGFALLGALAATAGTALLVTVLSIQYLVARVLVAGATGMANYLLNLHLNFKVAGHHP